MILGRSVKSFDTGRFINQLMHNCSSHKNESVYDWALFSEHGLLRFPQHISKNGIAKEFIKIVLKTVSAQYCRTIIGRLLRLWLPIRRFMEAKNRL